ncbi:MAG: hypothetical protein NZ770_03420, partial [Candidatus Poseidoniaceae archaeon]|nr:hypothetical protein [Candidatus Poseidoniaceae archaeon]
MRRRAILLLAIIGIALIATPQFQATPGGIGSTADDSGCFCHTKESGTEVSISGLPDTFNASAVYNLTITVSNSDIPGASETANMGGFRLLINGGTLDFDQTLVHVVEGGLTHTELGNDQRSWEVSWTAPADDTKVAEFTLWGNAVNGNANGVTGNSGDGYNGAIYQVAGLNAGPIEETVDAKRAMVVLMTAILLVLTLMGLAAMYVFYSRNPEGFNMGNFWGWLKGWLTTTDHKGVGLLYL